MTGFGRSRSTVRTPIVVQVVHAVLSVMIEAGWVEPSTSPAW